MSMPSLKTLKGELKKQTSKNPEKFYALQTLKEKGFHRERCEKCGKYFWTSIESKLCGDPECSGSYTFIGNPPTKKRMDFIQVWQGFSKLFRKLGYTPIKRYPVVARWRDDVYWTNASIYDFQPHVVSGAVEPPANPLVVPQVCIRFNDIDNVGLTGRHYTSFVMMGQHAFVKPSDFDKDKYLEDIFTWLEKGMGLPLHELKFHEDQWGGGGNLGVCMEWFCRGLEIGNQVYMTYKITPEGYEDLDLNVLDMGTGQERHSWISKGTSASYDVNFPTVVEALYRKTGIKPDESLMQKFLPYSGLLNADEVSDIEKVWLSISKKLKTDVKHLKKEVLSLAALYAIGDHTRTLLFAINDGSLPSNVGGAYNLRVLLRRCLGFIEKYGWKLELGELCEIHAKYLKPQYPELMENLSEVSKILDVEKAKFYATREKSKKIVQFLLSEKISENTLIELYDSHGITPEFLQQEFQKFNAEIKIPDDFYAKVAARHPDAVEKKTAAQIPLVGVPDTKALYFENYQLAEAKAKVLKVINEKLVVLDKTIFFPTSGGQVFDLGTINGIKVTDVQKHGSIIVHVLESGGLKEKQEVLCKIDIERRLALTKNHTSAHIIGGAARKVLGKHIWQAGSQIEVEKGRLDITHYENLTEQEKNEIEKIAFKIISENRKIHKEFMDRNEAEKLYGFTLYQGGAVPGKKIRVVNIENWDVQACGGTHLDRTGEAEGIRILKTEKIQDGVVRIIFVASCKLLVSKEKAEASISDACVAVLSKLAGDSGKLSKTFPASELQVASQVFSVQPKLLPQTLERFIKELKENEKISEELCKVVLVEPEKFSDSLCRMIKTSGIVEISRALFESWKAQKKSLKVLEEKVSEKYAKEMLQSAEKIKGVLLFAGKTPTFNTALSTTLKISSEKQNSVIIISSEGKTLCTSGNEKISSKETLNILLPNAKISGDSKKAVALSALGKTQKEIANLLQK